MAHVLYRFYSATGQLLYVGITMNPPQRFKSHQDDKGWWEQVSGISVETYENRADLARAERRAIQVERPRYNVVHNANRVKEDLDELPGGWKNPAGIVEFDDSEFATLEGWQELALAMNKLYLEFTAPLDSRELDTEMHEQFLAVIGRLARSICFMIECPDCPEESPKKLVAPHRAQVPGGSMCAYYRCDSGHEWFEWTTLRRVFFEQWFAIPANLRSI